MNNDYIITLPLHPSGYGDLLWKFLDRKNFQIHKCIFTDQNMVLVTTLYFPPTDLISYFYNALGARHDVTFTKRTKKPKRPYTRRSIPDSIVLPEKSIAA